MASVKGSPRTGLCGATVGFFVGFAAVALFGPTASRFRDAMELSSVAVGFLVAAPALSGSLLRIPFSAWVDTTGGRKPFLVLLILSLIGMVGLTGVSFFLYPDHLGPGIYPLLLLLGVLAGCGIATFSVGISQVAYWHPSNEQGRALAVFAGVGNLAPGIFSFLIPLALSMLGLGGSYMVWLVFLVVGVGLYYLIGRNAWYFQLVQGGLAEAEARERARDLGQAFFPTGSLLGAMRVSAGVWQTWALVMIYFSTFGGFIALTAWLPTYWMEFFHTSAVTAGILTAVYSIITSAIRILGGVLADCLQEGGENTAVLALLVMLVGSILMAMTDSFALAVPAVVMLAVGMGMTNAAVFKMVPQAVPQAVGGASGWVGGLGAFGGFLIPPLLGVVVTRLGSGGYPAGFIVFVVLSLISLWMVWILKYIPCPEKEPELL